LRKDSRLLIEFIFFTIFVAVVTITNSVLFAQFSLLVMLTGNIILPISFTFGLEGARFAFHQHKQQILNAPNYAGLPPPPSYRRNLFLHRCVYYIMGFLGLIIFTPFGILPSLIIPIGFLFVINRFNHATLNRWQRSHPTCQ